MIGYRFFCIASGAISISLLSGCGASTQVEIQQWMSDQKSQIRPRIKPISEPTKFKPESYSQLTAVDPFNSQKLTQALKKDSAKTTSGSALIDPEIARKKEILESYPLDSMTLVGSMMKAGKPVAIIKINGLLHQLSAGDYLGQNYGRATKISESEINIREIIQDSTGEWIERISSLQLQEGSK